MIFDFTQKKMDLIRDNKDNWLTSPYFSITLKKNILKKRMKLVEYWIHGQEMCGVSFCDFFVMKDICQKFFPEKIITDVLSFNSSPTFTDNSIETDRDHNYLGDIIICLPYCLWFLRNKKTSLSSHLERLIIHGMIHLKGFDHERSSSAYKIMHHLETQIFKELNHIYGEENWITCKTHS